MLAGKNIHAGTEDKSELDWGAFHGQKATKLSTVGGQDLEGHMITPENMVTRTRGEIILSELFSMPRECPWGHLGKLHRRLDTHKMVTSWFCFRVWKSIVK